MVGPERLTTLLRQCGAWPPRQGEERFLQAMASTQWRFEVLAQALGAVETASCDASAYEGADLVHDLNEPIPATWEQRFDLVLDGGTLEHVFNFPVAILNCMRWLKPGGHLILITPANNFLGHGFFQFSPELFYRVLRHENGFDMQRMIATVDAAGFSRLFGVDYSFPVEGPWYEVPDPASVRSRITLINDQSVLLYVLARKAEHLQKLSSTPQQSDYSAQWNTGQSSSFLSAGLSKNSLLGMLLRRFGESFCREMLPRLALPLDPLRWWRFRRRNSFRNRSFYRPVSSVPKLQAARPPAPTAPGDRP